jgi:hypothetical protein
LKTKQIFADAIFPHTRWQPGRLRYIWRFIRSDIMFVRQEYAAPDGAFPFVGGGSTNMPRRWRWGVAASRQSAANFIVFRWRHSAEMPLRQFFAVWQMVAVPAHQGNVAGVGK